MPTEWLKNNNDNNKSSSTYKCIDQYSILSVHMTEIFVFISMSGLLFHVGVIFDALQDSKFFSCLV